MRLFAILSLLILTGYVTGQWGFNPLTGQPIPVETIVYEPPRQFKPYTPPPHEDLAWLFRAVHEIKRGTP